jgi:hypothetical protein
LLKDLKLLIFLIPKLVLLFLPILLSMALRPSLWFLVAKSLVFSNSVLVGASAISVTSGSKVGLVGFSASVAEGVSPVNSGTEAGSI